MKRDGFLFYASFFDAIEELKEAEQLETLKAIIKYGLNGEEYDGNGIAKALYKMAKPQIDANNKRYENGKKGGAPKGNANAKKETEKKEAKKRETFKPPTIEEVKSYCDERRNSVNAEKFIDFYESKGWLVGKNKMKDWRACVRTWERRETKTDKFNNAPARDYEMDDLELKLLSAN